jgi:hypothetical protein
MFVIAVVNAVTLSAFVSSKVSIAVTSSCNIYTLVLINSTLSTFAVNALLIPVTACVNVVLTAPTNKCVAADSIPVAFTVSLIASIRSVLSIYADLIEFTFVFIDITFVCVVLTTR